MKDNKRYFHRKRKHKKKCASDQINPQTTEKDKESTNKMHSL